MISFIKTSLIFVLSLGVALLFLQTILIDLRAASPDIFISEIQFDGSSKGGSDKWIELYNPTQNLISLDNYQLELNFGRKVLLTGFSIDSNKTLLLVNSMNSKPSLIREIDVQNFGFVNLMTISNTTTNPYIFARLIKQNEIVSAFTKNSPETLQLMNTDGSFRSIEITQNGEYNRATNAFYSNLDFGSPGAVYIPTIPSSVQNVEPLQPIPALVDTQSQPPLISQPSIAVFEPQIYDVQIKNETVSRPQINTFPQESEALNFEPAKSEIQKTNTISTTVVSPEIGISQNQNTLNVTESVVPGNISNLVEEKTASQNTSATQNLPEVTKLISQPIELKNTETAIIPGIQTVPVEIQSAPVPPQIILQVQQVEKVEVSIVPLEILSKNAIETTLLNATNSNMSIKLFLKKLHLFFLSLKMLKMSRPIRLHSLRVQPSFHRFNHLLRFIPPTRSNQL
jgi:hypothetical protein